MGVGAASVCIDCTNSFLKFIGVIFVVCMTSLVYGQHYLLVLWDCCGGATIAVLVHDRLKMRLCMLVELKFMIYHRVHNLIEFNKNEETAMLLDMQKKEKM